MNSVSKSAIFTATGLAVFITAVLLLSQVSSGQEAPRYSGAVSIYGPTEPVLPGEPLNVSASVGRGEISVTWDPPETTGSFPVTNYRVDSLPSGPSCLTESIPACVMSDLVAGREYQFTVQALNGAGWGPPSAPSAPVVALPPLRPSIAVRGSLAGGRLVLVMSTADIPPGAQLDVYLRRPTEAAFTMMPVRAVVSEAGTSTWSRRWPGRAPVSVYVAWETVRSSTLRLRPASPSGHVVVAH